jgi:hypothetical protein
MRKYSARSLKNLNGIHPDLRRVIDRALLDSPMDFTVIEGLRTKERHNRCNEVWRVGYGTTSQAGIGACQHNSGVTSCATISSDA